MSLKRRVAKLCHSEGGGFTDEALLMAQSS